MTIQTVGIIGAGTMGNGIAQVCAAAGLQVKMVDISEAAVQKGLATISSNLERLVKKDKLTAEGKQAILARIAPGTDYEAFCQAQLVIEAATENYELKLSILRKVDALVAPEVIISSNTSSISITKLAAATSRADRFIGMHFFNPVPVMGLVEIITGLQTSAATVQAIEALATALGKTSVTAKNQPGFAVNRILCPMLNEAFCALGEGVASAEEIDAAMKLGCNHPLGPLALADMIGLDTLLAIMEVLYREFADSKYRPAMLLREYVAAGYLGRKSGRGVYDYQTA